MSLRNGFLALLIGVLGISPVGAQDLPKSTLKMMQDRKLDLKLLDGVEKELVMPDAWIEGAKKEKILRIAGTWDPPEFNAFARPFQERYPYITLRYSRGSRFDRVTRPLVAYKSGRNIIDVITGIGGEFAEFKQAGALHNLLAVPNVKNIPDGMTQKDGWWVGQRLRYWCMSYNTQKVAKASMPKTWDDVVTSPAMRNGNIGMGNRPNLWLLPMWEVKGETWIRNFAEKLFAVNKPQLRNEGMNALADLAIVGEFDVALPSAEYRTKLLQDKGAPISWHCPEPVPFTISEMIVLKGSNTNGAMMFVNWFLSKEGQISQYATDLAPPVHKDLQTRDFLAYPEEILGRPYAYLDPELLEKDLSKLMKIWEPLWYSGKGLQLRVVKAELSAVEKGRSIVFSVDGAKHTAKMSEDSTRISIKGEKAVPSSLAAGMSCEITYAGNNQDAIRVECN